MVEKYDRVRSHRANGSTRPPTRREYLRFGGDGQVVRAGPVVSRRERHIVRESQKPDPLPTLPRHGKDRRSGGFFAVTAGPGVPDAGVVQVHDGVEQALFLEVHVWLLASEQASILAARRVSMAEGGAPEMGTLGRGSTAARSR